MSSDPNYSAHIDKTMGSLWWGLQVATILWGVTTTQTWYYYENYKKDHIFLKLLVKFTFKSSSGIHVDVAVLRYRSGRFFLLIRHTKPLFCMGDVTINGLTGAIVQAFFVYRIWVFSKGNVPVMLLLSAMVFTLLNYGVLQYFNLFSPESGTLNIHDSRIWAACWNSLTAVTDVSITVAVCYYLGRSKTGFAASETMLNRITVLAVNTGAITSVWTILILITVRFLGGFSDFSFNLSAMQYLSLPGYYVYFGMYLVIGRLYANSLLATLNARQKLRSTVESTQDAYNLGQFPQRSGPGNETTGAVQIHMNIETVKELEANQDDETSSHGYFSPGKGR
ncbi:hypothetical protein VNI00_012661 [Paramarasmius palmivorus]|uniref:DUF6534 domain-containing protein n=1 Tax=Paramarasmius palmivorus TaxID=297713 RepID=A0AAW0C555_9AGAR